MVALTEGALERMLRNEEVQSPTLQITALKRVDGNPSSHGGQPRYRIVLNDGIRSTSCALLSSQKSEAAARGEVDQYAVLEVNEYICNTVQNRRLIILVDFTVKIRGSDIGEELGSPTAIDLSTLTDGGGAGADKNRPVLAAQQQKQDITPPILRDQAPEQRAVAISHPPAGNGSVASNLPPPNVFPLASITPYQNKWSVRARVTKKYPIRTYHNSRGEGKVFSVDLADESGEMRATGFNQECDKFYEYLKEGSVYFIRGGTIKAANRQWTSINNDYELTFNSETDVQVCLDDNVYQLPTVTFNFVKFDKLPSVSRDRGLDVIGIVESYSQCQSLTSRKTNQELKKRDILLVDDSLNSVSLTLWGNDAENFNEDGHPVLAVKGVRVSDFNGLSLSAIQGSQLHTNPEVPEAFRLRGWYDSRAHDGAVKSLTTTGGSGQGMSGGGGYIAIALAEADRLGHGDKPDYYSVKGFVKEIRKENCIYKACPEEGCNKKLFDQGNGRNRCEKCNKEFDNFKWRMMLQMRICDFSGEQPMTLFNEQAEYLLGMSAQDLADMRERSEEEFHTALEKPLFKQYSFRLRAKLESYNDETRVKVMCNRIEELNLVDYSKFLTEEIQKMEALPDPM